MGLVPLITTRRLVPEYEQLEKGLIGESIVAVASDFETSTGFVLLFDGRIECEKHLAIVFLSYPIDGLAFVPNSSSCYSMRSAVMSLPASATVPFFPPETILYLNPA
ncbi:hypothetical protein V6N11_014149 [Hibiscus sabdariffa]|uniref:Uncharacterized protein n=1 Tax=Hibiscus sabdariffa TaxID=183260 RepID=A0ABR2AGE8_9ROSI